MAIDLTELIERHPSLFRGESPVSVVPWWRDSLVELAEELPGFRTVLGLVRNAHAAAEAADRPPAVPPMLGLVERARAPVMH